MRNKKIVIILVFLFAAFIFVKPTQVFSVSKNFKYEDKQVLNINHSLVKKKKNKDPACSPVYEEGKCASLLGNPECSESVAWLVQQIFTVLKYMGPILVVVLSSIDFAKTILDSNQESMTRAQKKLIYRLIAVVALFLVPDLILILLTVFDIIGDPNDPTCGVK